MSLIIVVYSTVQYNRVVGSGEDMLNTANLSQLSCRGQPEQSVLFIDGQCIFRRNEGILYSYIV